MLYLEQSFKKQELDNYYLVCFTGTMELTIPNLSNPLISSLELDDSPILDEDLKNDIITYCEANFHYNGKFPTRPEIVERFDLSEREFLIYLSAVAEPLKNRTGVLLTDSSSPVKTRGPENKIDPLFALAVTIMVDTADKRSTAAKIKSLDLTTKQWQAFLSIPSHAEYFKDRLNKAFKGTEESAKLSLAKLVESGDLQGIKYFHEFTGLHKPQNETNMNLLIVLGRVMEILSRFVSPEIMGQIADEIDSVIEVKEITAA